MRAWLLLLFFRLHTCHVPNAESRLVGSWAPFDMKSRTDVIELGEGHRFGSFSCVGDCAHWRADDAYLYVDSPWGEKRRMPYRLEGGRLILDGRTYARAPREWE